MSVMRAWGCGGRGGAARGPVDRGVLLRRVVVVVRASGQCALSSVCTGLVSGVWLVVLGAV